MPFTTEPTQADPTATPYSNPSNADLAAVAATVSIVGVLMALLITWLVLRLRHASAQSTPAPDLAHHPTSNASYIPRPSFAPSEASSKFGFTRKPLRLTRRHHDGSWDFADPDPVSHLKESLLDPPPVRTPSQKRRPAPLSPAPAYTPRARRTSTHKDELGPRTPTTPTTPASADCVEPPPPAYCRETTSPWPVFQPTAVSPP